MVSLDKLEVGNYQFDFQLDNTYFSGIEKTELLGGMVDVKAQLSLRQNDFDLQMSVQGMVQVTCDRCLDSMDVEVNAEEMLEFEEGTRELDLEWLAYEMIIVNLPLVHRHPEGGCNPEMDALLQNHLCRTEEEPETI